VERFHFPAWVNTLLSLLGPVATLGLIYVVAVVWFGAVPATTDVGYAPKQPIPYSHKLHAGDLKIDCRYCHTTVENAAFAAIPPTSTCMNCHSPADAAGQVQKTAVHTKSLKLEPARASYLEKQPIEWIKVHDLPDYVYFNHSAHVTRGVSCVECHGRVDRMEVVYQAKELSMSWCLDCHRNPDPHLRPPELVTKLDWVPPDGKSAEEIGSAIREQRGIHPSVNCSTCHR
jgi:hypothetical protein